MSQCNLCTLRAIRRRARYDDWIGRQRTGVKRKTRISVVERMDGSATVHADGEFRAWFMRLPDHCACDE